MEMERSGNNGFGICQNIDLVRLADGLDIETKNQRT